MATQSISDGSKIAFRGFSQLEDPVLGKVVSYLSPTELQITAFVSKKMQQMATPKLDIEKIMIKRKILKDIDAVEKLIKRGHIEQAIKSAAPIFDKFAMLQGSILGLYGGVRSIALGIVESLINTGEIETAIKVAKMIFEPGLHDELFSSILDELISQDSIESLKRACQIAMVICCTSRKNIYYEKISLKLVFLRHFELAAQVANKVYEDEDVSRLDIYVSIVKGLNAKWTAHMEKTSVFFTYEDSEARQIKAIAHRIVNAIPDCSDRTKKAILEGTYVEK